MSSRSHLATRRAFLGGVLTSATAASVAGARTRLAEEQGDAQVDLAATLMAVGEVVLPRDELGAEGVRRQVEQFERWSRDFEPVAELDHPYLSSDELRYGPPDPRPNWRAQLEALDAETRLRWQTAFHSVPLEQRRLLIEREIDRLAPARTTKTDATAESPAALPFPFAAEAPHVAIALLSWFTSTSFANDLCYGSAIGRHECRGLPSVEQRPAPLERLASSPPGEPK